MLVSRLSRVVGVCALVGLAACSVPSTPSAPTAGSSQSSGTGNRPTTLVLGESSELGGYNPVRGYAELGVSPLYDGLMRLEPTSPSQLPSIVPALAAAAPIGSPDLRTWTVKLRSGVTFHDGTTFDAADVVATYRAILDPASGSDIESSLDMVASVEAPSADTVVFTLKYPYVDFPSRMLIGIAPSERLRPGKAEDSELNTKPVGTGPYRLAELTPDRAVFEANETYWAGPPAVKKFTSVLIADDNARAQRMAAGELDGTSLPPRLASTLAGRQGLTSFAAQSADWRAVSLPKDTPFTRDPAARMAMNLAVDRATMVSAILAGTGRPAYSPVSPVYGAAYEKAGEMPRDVAKAKSLLDSAGWIAGPDGVRRKDGQVAGFTLAYRPTDTLRRDLATAFAADMRGIGVQVALEGLTFDAIKPRKDTTAILLGGGDKPYSLDTQVYGALHTPVPGSAWWDNPGGFGSPALDKALDTARRTSDQAAREAAYREVQREYAKDPFTVYLVFLEHTYVAKSTDWTMPPLVVEPHSHGVEWGPWWRLAGWR